MLVRRAGVGREESGAVLILTVIVLVVMLGLSALVIDIGYAKSQKRDLQNAADASALGAAQNLADALGPNSADVEAQTLGTTNYTKQALPWATSPSCTPANDPGRLPNVDSGAGASQCVTFDSSFTQIRVRIPRLTFRTLFGGVMGFSSTSASTTAIAEVAGLGESGVLPFALFSGFGSGIACLDEGGGTPSKCPPGAPVNGFFGDLDMFEYGNARLGTTPSCSNGGSKARLSQNIAMGADHFYDTWTHTPFEVDDACTGTGVSTPGPNTVGEGTGNASDFDAGLMSGTAFPDGQNARLQRVPTSWPGGWPTLQISGVTDGIDNRPLYTFIDPALDNSSTVPSDCWPSKFASEILLPNAEDLTDAQMLACIADYQAASPGQYAPLFTRNDGPTESPADLYDIQSSPRFSYVPQMLNPAPVGAGCNDCLDISRFRAMFIQEVMSNNPSKLDFEPGPWNMGPYSGTAMSMTAYILPGNMLPGDLGSNPVSIGQNAAVELVG
jgi:hypothetical protein